MRFVGIRRDGGQVQVAALADDGASVTVVAGLEEFWADAAGHLTGTPSGETVAASEVEFVPPVLPGARVICIGLNYLKHVAEGSFAGQDLPPPPTLFARWTQSLTVDGAQVPVPSNEEGIDWVNRDGKAWPAVIGDDAARQVGAVVAYDPATQQHREIWGMGRFNHENSVAIPGFKKVVLLSGDDTFTNNPS